jgi:hypothetical protein
MEKQEAIHFIHQQLDRGLPATEIVEKLTAELHAPKAAVEKFVAQVAERYIRPPAPSAESQPPVAPIPKKVTLPLWLEGLASDGVTLLDNTPFLQIASKPQAETPQAQPAAPSKRISDPALEQFVLHQLLKNRKRSDIALAVAERAGVDWHEAQRLVGHVAALNHAKLAARRNMLIIPIGVVFTLTGLGMAAVSAWSLAPTLGMLTGQAPISLQAMPNRIDQVIGALFLGMALAAGGIIGIVIALRGQTD